MILEYFDVNNYDKNKRVVLICYRQTLDIAKYCLELNNIPVWRFYDPDVQDNKNNYISLEEVVRLDKNEEILAVLLYKYCNLWLLDKLDNAGLNTVYSIRNLFSKNALRNSSLYETYQNTIELLDDSFFYEDLFGDRDHGKVYISSLDATITSKCTLRCKDCSNLMQYYKNPSNYNISDLICSIEKVLTKIDKLNDLRILGGEPFVNKEIKQLISHFKSEPKINKISVYSNATILPSVDVLNCLKESGALLIFSDYGELSYKLEDWIKWCKDNGVGYVVDKIEWWQDCGVLERGSDFERSTSFLYLIQLSIYLFRGYN